MRWSSEQTRGQFGLVCRTPGNIESDFRGFWGAGSDENQVVSHSPACLCIWVCSALISKGCEADCWRLVIGLSQAELVAPSQSHEPPHECAGLRLGFLYRPDTKRVGGHSAKVGQ